jgi:menaquinone-dependent protoporphyrinogen IX oxidase
VEEIMNKALVLYSSKYGSTKKYADWIKEEINGDSFEVDKIDVKRLPDYDVIILGGGLYAGKIKGIKLLVDNYEKIKGRKIIIFICGLSDFNKVEHKNNVSKQLQKAIPTYIFENIEIFYLRGSIDYKKLNIIHKLMMGLMKKMILKKKKKLLKKIGNFWRHMEKQ